MEESPVDNVLFAIGLFHAEQKAGGGVWNGEAFDVLNFNFGSGFGVRDAAGFEHQVDKDFIGDAHHKEILEIGFSQIANGFVREHLKCCADASLVFRGTINKEVDDFGGANKAMLDDGKAADDEVFGLVLVEAATDLEQVVFGWECRILASQHPEGPLIFFLVGFKAVHAFRDKGLSFAKLDDCFEQIIGSDDAALGRSAPANDFHFGLHAARSYP